MRRFIAVLQAATLLSACSHELPRAAATGTVSRSDVARAIARAEDALKTADTAGFLWSDSETLLAQARGASAGGNEARAVELADQARTQGELAINQYYLARAKDLLDTLKRGGLSAAQTSSIAKVQDRFRNSEGKAAFEQIAAIASQNGVIVAPFPGPILPSRIIATPAPVATYPAPSYPVHHGRPH